MDIFSHVISAQLSSVDPQTCQSQRHHNYAVFMLVQGVSFRANRKSGLTDSVLRFT